MKLFVSILLVISVSYAQLRTPQSIWGSLERVSPLNDKNYFEVMDKHAKKLGKIAKTKQMDSKKLKRVKLFKFKSTLRSYAYGKKFYEIGRASCRERV